MGKAEPRRRRGDYGFDGDFRLVPAKVQAVLIVTMFAVLLGFVVFDVITGRDGAALGGGLIVLLLAFTAASFAFTTRVGKFQVWARILAGLELRGDERLLDLGCGRGAVLLAAAELLPEGHATGVDKWRPDQTGNSPEATRRNAELECVAARVTLHTGDMTGLPFADSSFDVVVSSFAIHHIPAAAGRRAAIEEAVRVLRPGGRLVIADLGHTREYLAWLRELDIVTAERRNLGWRVWWGGPWFPSHVVTGTKSR
ncbi:class I SAM-dependent methyltransferase [Amycolatopsis magusensis]|uniref:SAM-dependent methyltransferase n=1 Tax=Amycolatopsis magusensis TaxID=882444 RepID=A0ABS4PUX9_9PSEU|nr:class I SAM-dependent methyltransferase [Amycolatopsis magusensis]MBP2182648.1 SAM-dependent methyltransferase [Amycolatopsis magusensis]